jgi:hypothetical protein
MDRAGEFLAYTEVTPYFSLMAERISEALLVPHFIRRQRTVD